MLIINKRQKRTLLYLWIATAISWAFLFQMSMNNSFEWQVLLPPLLFGIGLLYSNNKYLDDQFGLLIPVIFFVIYFWGTLPFYGLGKVVYEVFSDSGYSGFLETLFGCIGAFALVVLTCKLTLTKFHIGVIQTILIVGLPIICVLLVAFFLKISIFEAEHYIIRFDVTVLIYQLFMTLILVSAMEANDAIEGKIENINT